MRKYIDELGIKFKDTPQGWNLNDDRQEKWKKQREEYGFDERETWGLDYTLKLWLYERLNMYNEVNCVNTQYHKIYYKDEELTFQDCLDRMIEGLKLDLTTKMYSQEKEEVEVKINDVFPILALCYDLLWW